MVVKDLQQTEFYKHFHVNGALTLNDFVALEGLYEFKELPSDTYLLRAGEIATQVFFVEKGLLISSTLNDRGTENILHFALESWLVADRSSLYRNEPSPFYIKTIEPSTIVFLHKNFLQRASLLNQKFACFNDEMLQRNILVQEKRIQSLLSMSATERYLSFMETYPNIILRVPQWMVASYLGITPESLSRIRKEIARNS